MSVQSAHGLTTPRAADWRDQAACRTEDPALFFPKGNTGTWLIAIDQAKSICRRCPSVDACLQFALTEPVNEGIYGGLTEQERAGLKRAKTRRALTADNLAARAEAARQPTTPRTLQGLFDKHTTRLWDDHLAWTGPPKLSFRGQPLTAKQLCFVLDRGHNPTGRVMAECGNSKCVLPQHLSDQEERGLHGNRTGYQRHRANGEEACDACRRANTDADNRLRRTGTTKALAS